MDIGRNDITVNMDAVPEDLVFGLDIGTRSIVGTLGYKNEDGHFIVVAQSVVLHETRAMIDGQIHDVNKVSDSIRKVKDRLESMTGRTLQEVCIAAAGRVLKTVDESAEVVFGSETLVTNEHVYSLDMLAVEKAHEVLRQQEDDKLRFYCVGYSVKQYYQNDFPISNLEGHKCLKIKTELIATFLPDEVVDGLYAAVERAGLYVANLTLEPIAAINVAIPERYRLLNIALVDVGAGTSDISITKDGSIIAYGMIPAAGDEITECLSRHYLVDFQEADRLKCAASSQEEVEFHDIMGLPQKVSSKEVAEVIRENVQSITKSIADKIIELNGGRTVSAVFVVGGGGKALGFVEYLAEYLDLMKERVALRGLEVLGNVSFLQNDVCVDSLLVTPIGICLNYYEQRNNFIFVHVNEERIRLYDNNRLTILDAALQVGIPNEVLFAQRGDAISYTVNGEQRMLRGEPGEPAVIRLNGVETGISTAIAQNDMIEVIPSTKGKPSVLEVGSIPEYKSQISYYVNGKLVTCPCFVSVNGELVSEYYEIQNGDRIEILNYYTLSQVLEFMDITMEGIAEVNHLPATADTKVYENFSVDFEIVTPPLQRASSYAEEIMHEEIVAETVETAEPEAAISPEPVITSEVATPPEPLAVSQPAVTAESVAMPEPVALSEPSTMSEPVAAEPPVTAPEPIAVAQPAPAVQALPDNMEVAITVNGDSVVLKGKQKYIIVDILDFYPIDTSVAHGDRLEIKRNGMDSDFTDPVFAGDAVIMRWIVETAQ